MNFLAILSAFLFILNVKFSSSTKSHPITTIINAKYSITPIQLEISEYLSDENHFWEYLDDFLNYKVPINELESDLDKYKLSIKLAEKYLTVGQLKLLKLTLSLSSNTPRIQSVLQVIVLLSIPHITLNISMFFIFIDCG
jgi:hypothetical protein